MAISTFSSVPQFIQEKSLTIADVPAITTPVMTFTGITGLTPDMTVVVNPTSEMPTDLALAGAYCSAAGTLKIRFCNPTASTITGAAVTFKILGL